MLPKRSSGDVHSLLKTSDAYCLPGQENDVESELQMLSMQDIDVQQLQQQLTAHESLLAAQRTALADAEVS